MKLIFPILLFTLWAVPVYPGAAENPVAELAGYKQKVKPLLTKYCVGCHGPEKVKAELRIDQLDPDFFTGPDAEHWEEVYNQLNIGDMPPEDDPQPTPGEREIISDWVHSQLRQAAELKRSSGGSNVLRRMTRYEYSNTLRDLLGLDLDFAKDLPTEGSASEGFVNNSAVLGTSALHIEYFQRIASSSIRKAMMPGEKAEPFELEFEPETLVRKPVVDESGKKKKRKAPRAPISVRNAQIGDSGVLLLPSAPRKQSEKKPSGDGSLIQVTTKEIPLEGPLRISVTAKATNAVDGNVPRLYIALGIDGGNSASPFAVLTSSDVSSTEFREYVFQTRAERFPLLPLDAKKSQFVRIRNVFDSGTAEIAKDKLPGLVIDSVKIEGNVYSTWPPETRTKIVENPEAEAEVEVVLNRFMTRAYRRPPLDEEVERMLSLYQKLGKGGLSGENVLIETLSAVLSSPGFLLLAEPTPENVETEKRRSLNSYEIASRLSYFLWSTMPDSYLFSLADRTSFPTRPCCRLKVPLSNLFVTMLDRMGSGETKFKDSHAAMTELLKG